jgi:S1-C subfamily serine protease
MHEEQSSEGQRPDPWSAWTSGQDGQPAQPDESRQEAAPGQPDQPASFTQPIGYPGAGQGRPGDYPPPPPPPFGAAGGYGQAGGYGYGQPGGYGYGPQPGGYGYGPPGYGQPGYGYGPPKRRRVANAIVYIAVALVAALVGGLTVYASGNHTTPAANSGSSNSGSNGALPNFGAPGNSNGSSGSNGAGSAGSGAVSGAAERKVQNAVMPGLVVISSNLQYQGDAAEATGMVISSSGLVLTNNHVIDGTTGLTATVVSTGQKFKADWLGYDKTADVAVVQLVGASGLRTVPIGNSSTVKVGDGVVAMGNANGTGGITTVTGQVTGLDKSITASDDDSNESENLTDMVETDAYIVPGDSGGPIANLNGQVIGMDTAASTDTFGTGQNTVGFAIPINRAMSIARQIIGGQSSSVVRVGSAGFLGVLVASGSNGQQSTDSSPNGQLQQQEQAANQNNQGLGGTQFPPAGTACLANDANPGIPSQIASVSSGTLVLGALCGTPASSVGMIPGDVITSLGGKAVSSPSSLVGILGVLHNGQTVSVTWATPSGSTTTKSMTLIAAPPQ